MESALLPQKPETSRLSSRRTFGILLLAVCLPLAALLAVQYSWLVDLERTSTIARLAALENYVETVAKEADYHYMHGAERALNLPADRFHPNCLEGLSRSIEDRSFEGVQRFVITFMTSFPGELYFFNRESSELEPAPLQGMESGAIHLAVEQWQRARQQELVSASELWVEESDPRYRIVLKPIYDEEDTLVGLGGMVLEPEYFVNEVLPTAIEEALPRFAGGDDLMLSVFDAEGRRVLPKEWVDATPDEVEQPFGFAFRDWKIGLRSSYSTPEQWARANFLFNVSLSVALALVLLGGVTLVLRTASREMKLSEMKSDFVSNVSHELRTPLASIRVFGELLRLGKVREPHKVQEFGEYIENESHGLSQLIDNILDFSRIESGRKMYSFEPTDIAALLGEVAESAQVRFRQRQLELEYLPPQRPLPTFEVDPDALQQAVLNLLDNAVKYSGAQPKVRLELTLRDDALVIAVSDRGIGIPADQQAKIFERFHRVGTGLVHDVKGCGLGLSIVHHVMEAHGGRVRVTSEPGNGSTFSLYLPLPKNSPGSVKFPQLHHLGRDTAEQPG